VPAIVQVQGVDAVELARGVVHVVARPLLQVVAGLLGGVQAEGVGLVVDALAALREGATACRGRRGVALVELALIVEDRKKGTATSRVPEIARDERQAPDVALAGDSPLPDVAIHLFVDHGALRALLRRLGALKRERASLSVLAVDAAAGEPRDEAMAAHLETAAQDTPVLALLGSIHSFKHVEWEPRAGDAPAVAELLAHRGVRVASVLQSWPGECAQTEAVLREPDL
jgi:hypothetical protein